MRTRSAAIVAATTSAAAATLPAPAAWPEVRRGPCGEPRFAHRRGSRKGDEEFAGPHGSGAAAAAFEADAQELLKRAIAIADACDAELAGEGAQHGTLRVERAMDKANYSVWLVHEEGQVAGTCSQAIMRTTVRPEAFLWSIYDVEERLTWDQASFVAYEVLSEATAQPGEALGDVIYCRMPAPTGMAERDVIQERFLLRLPDGVGFAIVMTSPSADAAAAHLRGSCHDAAGRPAAVRATTALSGYLIRPLPGGDGVRITAMSQTDLGGSIPAWMQAAAKKAGTQRFIQWCARLQRHCEVAGDSRGLVVVNRPDGPVAHVLAKQPVPNGGQLCIGGLRIGPQHLMLLVVAICAAVRVAACKWLIFGGYN